MFVGGGWESDKKKRRKSLQRHVAPSPGFFVVLTAPMMRFHRCTLAAVWGKGGPVDLRVRRRETRAADNMRADRQADRHFCSIDIDASIIPV